MKVSKWGNSLAIRIPGDLAQQLGIKEGDEVELQANAVNGLEIVRSASRAERIRRLVAIMRDTLPADFVFDREEANARR